jgi:uncharacterized protein YidB (DUF937 family)
MALFDSIVSGAADRFGLEKKKAETLLAALLALMTNRETGGLAGFIERFNAAGLGDTALSWIISGDNREISDEQVESGLGAETIKGIADRTGIDPEKTTSALAFMTPKAVDVLTPDGEIPDDELLFSRIGGFLTDAGVAFGGKTRTPAVAPEGVPGIFDESGDDGGSVLRWFLPLLLLGILIAVGYLACRDDVALQTISNANVDRPTKTDTATGSNAAPTATENKTEPTGNDSK